MEGKLSKREFLALPIADRRKLLEEQVTPELIEYYHKLAVEDVTNILDDQAMQDIKMME